MLTCKNNTPVTYKRINPLLTIDHFQSSVKLLKYKPLTSFKSKNSFSLQ